MRALIAVGADITSHNGPVWRTTPLHQAAYHGRFAMAKACVELGAPLDLPANSCGRPGEGKPAELARGGGHNAIAEMIEAAILEKKGGEEKPCSSSALTENELL